MQPLRSHPIKAITAPETAPKRDQTVYQTTIQQDSKMQASHLLTLGSDAYKSNLSK